ncbi:hypothetical protein [Nocardiopsis sp. B62]|uniref:hypothetical protein n=1 Tax=Nocardiopsis sp. B62 TaxID=2824874 RepID=UPI001B39B37F|nr:hypothetical protein [Nocardiopsis sp. B62]MBQ1083450.1 hypothetical protein [Nocardiopsis sp. B62]
MPEAFRATSNAEKYVLEADALRRRQLRSALLYGSSRFWRRKQRVWPAMIFGAIVVAVICGVIALIGAFDKQQEVNELRGRGNPLTSQSESVGH